MSANPAAGKRSLHLSETQPQKNAIPPNPMGRIGDCASESVSGSSICAIGVPSGEFDPPFEQAPTVDSVNIRKEDRDREVVT